MTANIEHEVTHPVDLCLPDGRLNPAAVGWSRTPMHRTALSSKPGLWGRNKRWEYWGVVSPTHIVGLTISNLDYAAVLQLWLLDRTTGEEISSDATIPLALGTRLPDTLGLGPSHGHARHLQLDFVESPPRMLKATTASGLVVPDGRAEPGRTTHLRARSRRVSVDLLVDRPLDGEAMCVVVPWSPTRFQYTVKDLAIPVSGTITVDGEAHHIGDDAWAVLDHGRGRWPYSMTWNWAAGSGVVDGRRLGLQLGGKWTDGTGSTENALIIDGVTHKISEDLAWEYDRSDWSAPWRVRGERVDVTFTPFHTRRAVTNLLVLAGDTTQCFGTWSGSVLDDAGTPVSVDGLVGWAEEAKNRW